MAAAPWIADRRIVVSLDRSRLLGPDEEQTGVQLATAGGPVSAADCERYGLGPFAAAVAEEPQRRGPGRPPKSKTDGPE